MSKERARRREQREAEAQVRAQARARAEEKAARRRRLKESWGQRLDVVRPGFLRSGGRPGQQTGILAARRRFRINVIISFLILVQAVLWILNEDWQANLAALVVSALAFPVIVAFAL